MAIFTQVKQILKVNLKVNRIELVETHARKKQKTLFFFIKFTKKVPKKPSKTPQKPIKSTCSDFCKAEQRFR